MGSCSFGLQGQAFASKEIKGLGFLQNDDAALAVAAAGLWQSPPSSNGVHHRSMAEDYNLKMIGHGHLLSPSALQARKFAAENQHLTKGKRCRRPKMSAAPVKWPLKHPTAAASPLGSFSQQWKPLKQEEPAESQLTIFYRGAVLVYNGVTQDQAQEIMLVANNRSKGGTPSSSVTSRAQVIPLQTEGALEANEAPPEIEIQNQEVPNRPGFKAPISLALSIGIQGSSPDGMVAVPSGSGYPTAQFRSVDVTAESKSAAAAVPRAIPQARKMSIARFLEKRKNRLVNCKPYGGISKNLVL